MRRNLVLTKETLSELTTDELAAVAGATNGGLVERITDLVWRFSSQTSCTVP